MDRFFPVRRRRHPSWNLRTQAVARILRTASKRVLTHRGPKQTRKQVAAIARLAPHRFTTRREPVRLGSQRATWIVPKRLPADAPITLYLHGGGFSICSPRTHRLLVTELAEATDTRCVAVAYRRAPNHPFPTPLNDCVDAYRALIEQGADPSRVIIAGDSAGGSLVTGTVQKAREEGLPMPRAIVLLSPWADLTCSGETIDSNSTFDFLDRKLLRYFARHYLQGHPATDPLVSPVFADFEGFPPMFIQVGTAELLLSEVRRMTKRAREHGVSVTLQEWEGMFHAWHGFSMFVPEGRAAIDAIGNFVRPLFSQRREESGIFAVENGDETPERLAG